MLVISRKENESLVIGDDIIVTVLKVRGDAADLRIKSPKESVDVSHKIGECHALGDNITISVVEIRDNKVRLGTDCPIETSIHRKEVYDSIHEDDEPQ